MDKSHTNEDFEKSNEYFTSISEHLKTELNLMDSDEYLRMKRQEAIARKTQLLASFKKSLDNFTLTKEEREIIEPTEDEIVRREPVQKNNAPIETLLEVFQNNDEESAMELECRFYGQSSEVQMRIIKAFLNGNEDNRRTCYWWLLGAWWDDAIIPDIEKNLGNLQGTPMPEGDGSSISVELCVCPSGRDSQRELYVVVFALGF